MSKNIFKTIHDIKYINKKKPIGAGAFSQVQLIYHKNNPKILYALKTLQKLDKTEESYIKQEISLHKNLHHKNIIKFIQYLETKKNVYIILEFAKNGDLYDFLTKNKPSKKFLTKIFFETCLAMKYLHSKNIVHRDIKPENLLLDENYNIKICDFGWSTKIEKNVKRETLCGTYEYMSPEVHFRKEQTKKSDIWALGIFLYEIFHGRAPFEGNLLNYYFQKKNFRIIFDEDLDFEVKELICGMLILEPEGRFEIEEVLEHPFFYQIKKDRLFESLRENSGLRKNSVKKLFRSDDLKEVKKNKVFENSGFGGMDSILSDSDFEEEKDCLKNHRVYFESEVDQKLKNGNFDLKKKNEYFQNSDFGKMEKFENSKFLENYNRSKEYLIISQNSENQNYGVSSDFTKNFDSIITINNSNISSLNIEFDKISINDTPIQNLTKRNKTVEVKKKKKKLYKKKKIANKINLAYYLKQKFEKKNIYQRENNGNNKRNKTVDFNLKKRSLIHNNFQNTKNTILKNQNKIKIFDRITKQDIDNLKNSKLELDKNNLEKKILKRSLIKFAKENLKKLSIDVQKIQLLEKSILKNEKNSLLKFAKENLKKLSIDVQKIHLEKSILKNEEKRILKIQKKISNNEIIVRRKTLENSMDLKNVISNRKSIKINLDKKIFKNIKKKSSFVKTPTSVKKIFFGDNFNFEQKKNIPVLKNVKISNNKEKIRQVKTQNYQNIKFSVKTQNNLLSINKNNRISIKRQNKKIPYQNKIILSKKQNYENKKIFRNVKNYQKEKFPQKNIIIRYSKNLSLEKNPIVSFKKNSILDKNQKNYPVEKNVNYLKEKLIYPKNQFEKNNSCEKKIKYSKNLSLQKNLRQTKNLSLEINLRKNKEILNKKPVRIELDKIRGNNIYNKISSSLNSLNNFANSNPEKNNPYKINNKIDKNLILRGFKNNNVEKKNYFDNYSDNKINDNKLVPEKKKFLDKNKLFSYKTQRIKINQKTGNSPKKIKNTEMFQNILNKKKTENSKYLKLNIKSQNNQIFQKRIPFQKIDKNKKTKNLKYKKIINNLKSKTNRNSLKFNLNKKLVRKDLKFQKKKVLKHFNFKNLKDSRKFEDHKLCEHDLLSPC